jgi:hypothetical protein
MTKAKRRVVVYAWSRDDKPRAQVPIVNFRDLHP